MPYHERMTDIPRLRAQATDELERVWPARDPRARQRMSDWLYRTRTHRGGRFQHEDMDEFQLLSLLSSLKRKETYRERPPERETTFSEYLTRRPWLQKYHDPLHPEFQGGRS